MEKQSKSCISQETIIKGQSPEQISNLGGFLTRIGVSDIIPVEYDVKNYFSNIIRGLLEVVHVESGRISFLLRVKPVVTVSNYFVITLFFSYIDFVQVRLCLSCLRLHKALENSFLVRYQTLVSILYKTFS